MPPYGELIEAAREAAGLSRREAARRAGISDAWWRYVTRGWQNGPITGPADTVATMARVTGVTPERLESEGQRPDAAARLREMLAEEAAREAEVPPLTHEDAALQAILDDDRLPIDVRRGMVALAEMMRRRTEAERGGGQGTRSALGWAQWMTRTPRSSRTPTRPGTSRARTCPGSRSRPNWACPAVDAYRLLGALTCGNAGAIYKTAGQGMSTICTCSMR
jgi:transcriptional regulator with XRE-family HTH domain